MPTTIKAFEWFLLGFVELNFHVYMYFFIITSTAEEEEVSFKFVGYDRVHTLPWSELLDLDETPFEAIQEIAVDQPVLAPWYDDSSTSIQHADAIIVSSELTFALKFQFIVPNLAHEYIDCIVVVVLMCFADNNKWCCGQRQAWASVTHTCASSFLLDCRVHLVSLCVCVCVCVDACLCV